MKKHNPISLMLLAPLALWAQTAELIDSGSAEPAVLSAAELTDVEMIDESSSNANDSALSGFGDIAAVNADVAVVPESQVDTSGAIATVVEPDVALGDVGEVVEIPDASIAGVVVDVQIPVVETSVLPSGSEVVLELPGQEAVVGSATMAEEETISVDFPDEDVRTILRNVADLFDLNVVIPDTLQGRTSVKLRNITWSQVFEVVLEPLGFTYVEDRNIIRIKSIADLVTEPVDTRVFILNYALSSEIQGSISPLIDPAAGGRIQVDARSNALVITERPSRMNKIQEVIDTLDRVTDQVMIESKFIEVRNGDLTDIGVDWAYLNENADDLAGGNAIASGTGGATASSGAGGLLAVFSTTQFAATLTALQNESRSKLVSNPTIVVMNNQQAVFQVGADYPIREFTVNDQTGLLETGEIEYRFVGIELDVTPSVNASGMITLDVHPVVSALGDTVITEISGSFLEDQIFNKRDAQTQVTIKDGYTIALGGLTEEVNEIDESKIPILGDLPYLGQLFRQDESNVTSTNLIIFLTAKTLNPDGSTYADVVDQRQLEVMKLTPSQIPGYEIPADQLQLINSVEAKRQKEISEEYKNKINAEFDERSLPKSHWMQE